MPAWRADMRRYAAEGKGSQHVARKIAVAGAAARKRDVIHRAGVVCLLQAGTTVRVVIVQRFMAAKTATSAAMLVSAVAFDARRRGVAMRAAACCSQQHSPPMMTPL